MRFLGGTRLDGRHYERGQLAEFPLSRLSELQALPHKIAILSKHNIKQKEDVE